MNFGTQILCFDQLQKIGTIFVLRTDVDEQHHVFKIRPGDRWTSRTPISLFEDIRKNVATNGGAFNKNI